MTFVDELFLFPTIIFTLGLGLCAVYWLMVIVGAIGIDAIELDGLFEGADGIDGALDGAVDGALDGAADGAADGATDGAADGSASHSAMWYVVQALALQKAPATVVFSVLFLWCWTLSMLTMHYVAPSIPLPPAVTSGLVLLASFGLGVGMTNRSVQPLGRLFEVAVAETRSDSVGRVCEIRTGRVTSTFGQAVAEDGGAGLLIEVRCDDPTALKKGAKALIIRFDPDDECYWVEPMDSVLASSSDVNMFGVDSAADESSSGSASVSDRAEDVETADEQVVQSEVEEFEV